MMHKEVYLFERIDSQAPREPIKHLKVSHHICLCIYTAGKHEMLNDPVKDSILINEIGFKALG